MAYKNELKEKEPFESSQTSLKANKVLAKRQKNERLVELYAFNLSGPGMLLHRKRPSRSISVTHGRAKSDRSLSIRSQRGYAKPRPRSVNRSRSRAKSKSNKSNKSRSRVRSKSRKDLIGEDGISNALRRAMQGPSAHREYSLKRKERIQRRSESAKKKHQFNSVRLPSRSKSR